MERVLGIGGFFFRARDPERLGRWYEEMLGVPQPPASYDDADWQQAAGSTVWGAFGQEDTSMAGPGQAWMTTFRVRDLEAMVAQLRAGDVTVEVDLEQYPNGRFASLADPEVNPIQLWQEMAPAES